MPKSPAKAERIGYQYDKTEDFLNDITRVLNRLQLLQNYAERDKVCEAREQMLRHLRDGLKVGNEYLVLLYGEQRRYEEGY